MEKTRKTIIVTVSINAPVKKVWEYWNDPKHIVQWCFASDDWETPNSENDLKVNGKFKTRMAAKDGSAAFDFGGVYTKIVPHEWIAYQLGDNRKVVVHFQSKGKKTNLTETFEMESAHSEEQQRAGWQAILNNFKKHVEEQ